MARHTGLGDCLEENVRILEDCLDARDMQDEGLDLKEKWNNELHVKN